MRLCQSPFLGAVQRLLPFPSARAVPAPLDETSKRIIEQLQEDGRRAYATIGKAVGLSEAAVRQRVQRLLESNVMQIVAVTDPLQVGFSRQAMIGIRCTGDTTKIAEELAAIPSVDYVVLTAGSFDAIVEVVCEDDDDLLDLLLVAAPAARSASTVARRSYMCCTWSASSGATIDRSCTVAGKREISRNAGGAATANSADRSSSA